MHFADKTFAIRAGFSNFLHSESAQFENLSVEIRILGRRRLHVPLAVHNLFVKLRRRLPFLRSMFLLRVSVWERLEYHLLILLPNAHVPAADDVLERLHRQHSCYHTTRPPATCPGRSLFVRLSEGANIRPECP